MYTLTIRWNMDKLRFCYPQSLSQIFHYSSGSLSRWLFNKICTTQSLAWNTEAKCRHSRNVLLTVGCPFLCCGININNNDGLSCVYQSIHPSLVFLQQWQALMGPNEVSLSLCVPPKRLFRMCLSLLQRILVLVCTK